MTHTVTRSFHQSGGLRSAMACHDPQTAYAVIVTVPPPVTVTTAFAVQALGGAPIGVDEETAPLADAP